MTVVSEKSASVRQTEVLEQLIKLSYRKRLAVTQNNAADLNECVQLEFPLASELGKLNNSGEKVTPTVLALAKELSERNRLNGELINTHMEYLKTMMQLMVPDNDPLNNLYDIAGRSVNSGKAGYGVKLNLAA
jgi:flagellar biosynthesis/type III secretory pathway chaperone